jgi:hypothetical protein
LRAASASFTLRGCGGLTLAVPALRAVVAAGIVPRQPEAANRPELLVQRLPIGRHPRVARSQPRPHQRSPSRRLRQTSSTHRHSPERHRFTRGNHHPQSADRIDLASISIAASHVLAALLATAATGLQRGLDRQVKESGSGTLIGQSNSYHLFARFQAGPNRAAGTRLTHVCSCQVVGGFVYSRDR